MSSRIIAALLASVGFLATFTIRSWHADLWHAGQATDYALVSALPHPAAARRVSIAASAPASTPQLRPPAPHVRAGRLEVSTARTPYLVTLSNAQAFLGERAREADHSGRAR